MLLTKPLVMIKDLAQGTVEVGLTVAGRVAGPVIRSLRTVVATRGAGGEVPTRRPAVPEAVPASGPSKRQGDPLRPVVAQPTSTHVEATPADVANVVSAKKTAAKKPAARKPAAKKAPAKKTAAPPAPEPLLDPATAKAIASESATLARAADPDKG